jgi:hypothetical protein
LEDQVICRSAKVNAMKLGRLLLLIFLVSPTGCSFIGYGVHNVISAPVEAIQECAFRHRLQNLARTAWQTIGCEEGHSYSKAYARGFEDGFVDYVDANGTGEPPGLPPACLRNGLLRSEAGQTDIDDWYEGFRHGARVARENGLRELAVMPIGLPPRPLPQPIPAQVLVPSKEMPPASDAPPIKEMPLAQSRRFPVKEGGPAPVTPIPVLEVLENRMPPAPPSLRADVPLLPVALPNAPR